MRLESYDYHCEWVPESANEMFDVRLLNSGGLPVGYHNWEKVGYKTHVAVSQAEFYQNWIKHKQRKHIIKFLRLPINFEYDTRKAAIASNDDLSVSDYEFLLSLGIQFYSTQHTRELHEKYLKLAVISEIGT